MDDEDAVPQDLSIKSQPVIGSFYFENHFNKINGNSMLDNRAYITTSTGDQINTATDLHSLHQTMSQIQLNGTNNKQDAPVDLVKEKFYKHTSDPIEDNNINNAMILPPIYNTSSIEFQSTNLKRKNNDHNDINRENLKPISPKHMKLFRSNFNTHPPSIVQHQQLQHPQQQQQHLYQQQQSIPAPYVNPLTPALSPEKQRLPITANCVQTGGLQALLNTASYKNTDEMKYFIKEQLQFTDLGKIFGNVDITTSDGYLPDYAQFLGLQPSVKFKCFKCDASTFLSLSELKRHQQICLKATNLQTLNQDNGADLNNTTTNTVESLALHKDRASGSIDVKKDPPEKFNEQQIDTKIRITRKVYLCSTCGTYYENWNLFYHMREVHKKFICLHCLGIFASAERLTHHLESRHTAKPHVYEHKDQLLAAIKDQCYLMCCVCEHVFSEHDDFTSHSCETYIQPCSLCGLKFIHRPNCKGSASIMSAKSMLAQKDREKLQRSQNNVEIVPTKNANQNRKRKVKARKTSDNKNEKLLYEQSVLNGFDDNKINDEPPAQLLSMPTPAPSPPAVVPPDVREQQKLSSISITHSQSVSTSSTNEMPTLMANLTNNWQRDTMLPHTLFDNVGTNVNNNQTKESSQSGGRNSLMKCSTVDDYVSNLDYLNGLGNEDFENIKRLVDQDDSTKVLNDYTASVDNSSIRVPGELQYATILKQNDEITTGTEPKQLLVPKLKLKISKAFQTPIESEESSTESDDEICIDTEENHDDNEEEDEEQIEADAEEGPIEAEIEEEEEDEEAEAEDEEDEDEISPTVEEPQSDSINNPNENLNIDKSENNINAEIPEIMKEKCEPDVESEPEEPEPKSEAMPIQTLEDDGIVEAGDDIFTVELLLRQPIDRIHIRDFLRVCLQASFPMCLYCNHARKIAVDCNSLARHFISQHKFSATVDSITAEELHPPTIVQRLRTSLTELDGIFLNLDSYDSSDKSLDIHYEKSYECFQCRFQSRIHKDLYLHNRKMHLKSILLCLMCKSNFFSYSELICHMCPGANSKLVLFDLKFRCVLCNLDNIPSAFRLMVHLRKKHFACDVCLEECFDQSKLSSHVWKHKLHHLCYRCGIAYRNKPDITKHLFWKHGTESVLCKRCLQKKWPHVYHFCIPPSTFVCEICNLSFCKAVSLKVHKRIHTDDGAPYPCTEDGCEKKFISRKLLLKHVIRHSMPLEEPPKPLPPVVVAVPEITPSPDKPEKHEKVQKIVIGNPIEEPPKENSEIKKKVKKSKKLKAEEEAAKNAAAEAKLINDIIDLPAPNLSESDSSDESDADTKTVNPILVNLNNEAGPSNTFVSVDDSVVLGEIDENKPPPIIDIWTNFQTYQANQAQEKIASIETENEPDIIKLPTLLHVVQSDHDYCLMYKRLHIVNNSIKNDNAEPDKLEEQLNEITAAAALSSVSLTSIDPATVLNENSPKHERKPTTTTSTTPKSGRSPKKCLPKSPSSESSSGDSSDSDSSCSCGSNCSCSTSSSSNSSSSSSDSDSTSSEGRRIIAQKKALKKEKRDRLKSESSFKANLSDNIDVVTTTEQPIIVYDPDTIIFESDLETDESETDEDFYDDHPQKMASQLLAEKRKQLMLQTCINPMNNYDIIENSRPSTPSLPEEMVKQKKVKTKKRKKDRKNSTKNQSAIKINIPLNANTISNNAYDETLHQPINLPPPPSVPIGSSSFESNKIKLTATNNTPSGLYKSGKAIKAGTIKSNQHPRLSTGSSCSDADTPLKRSKRRRIPNKFYGYTSDDESGNTSSNTTIIHAFKPIPPPNLTWRKEDLPSTPTFIRTPPLPLQPPSVAVPITTLQPPIKTVIKLPPSINYKTVSQPEYRLPSPIFDAPMQSPPPPQPLLNTVQAGIVPPAIHHLPPVVIRPNRNVQAPPPMIEPLRVPSVPVHHIVPPSNFLDKDSEQSADSTESDSSDEGALQISQPPSQTLKTTNDKPVTVVSSGPAVNPQYPDLPLHVQPSQIRYPIMPPAGCRPAREGESVYCYCRCPYDEVSEMIACDGENCPIEWFHFECVNIMVPPKGTWYCPQCRPKYINTSQQQHHYQEIT